jgi:peptidoglycan hydrolase CwlO-like protein
MNNDLFRNLVDKVSAAQGEIQKCVGSMTASIEHIKDNIESVTTEVTKHAYELGALQGKHAPGRMGK